MQYSVSKEALEKVFTVLKELGGYFTMTDDAGDEYVIMAKKDLADRVSFDSQVSEIQLPLQSQQVQDDIAEVNRAIATFVMQEDQSEDQEDEEVEEMAAGAELDKDKEIPPPRRVRFEAIRGDLPPELQE